MNISKPILALAALMLVATAAMGQAKKPTIMVVPSDLWCNQNGYMQTYDDQGIERKVPDYRAALQSNADLALVIAKLNELMTDRGFPLKNLESALKSVEANQAEESLLMSRDGGGISESPIDILKKTAKADIVMQIGWTLNETGPKKSVTFILQGLDAYTDKQIAGASGTGEPSFSAAVPVLLEEAVLSHLDNFNAQLQGHFDDLFANGREVRIRIRVWDTFDGDLFTEFGDDELGYEIEYWMDDNTVQGRYSTTDATENFMFFEQVRIPLYDERGRAVDTRRWARGLSKWLDESYGIESKMVTKGLGEVMLILGSK